MAESRWYDLGNGRSVYRPAFEPRPGKSDFPTPFFSSDTIDPTQSQADGKIYTSKQALRHTYKAEGNPKGINFVEVGNENLGEFTPPKRDTAKAIEAIERAEADVLAGRAPEIGTFDPSE